MGCHASGVIPDLACSLFGTEFLRFRLAGKLMLDDFAGRIRFIGIPGGSSIGFRGEKPQDGLDELIVGWNGHGRFPVMATFLCGSRANIKLTVAQVSLSSEPLMLRKRKPLCHVWSVDAEQSFVKVGLDY